MCRACWEVEHEDDDEENSEENSDQENGEPRERGPIVKQPLQTEIASAIDAIGEDSLGHIALPLNHVDARRIIAAGHQAPFGRKEQTIVDTTVRRTWEINAADLTIHSPAFEECIRNTVMTAVGELGVASNVGVTAELYKLLLYEPGAMFKPHVDSEKAPGMFATMIVCLPSEHIGGDVCLKHNGLSKTLTTAKCQPQPSYLCWFSNVEHEVKPVEQGYRLVLTYNLIRTDLAELHSQAPTQALGLYTEPKYLNLRASLQKWLELGQGAVLRRDGAWSRELIYCLEHQYTEASLGIRRLQGGDLAKVEALWHFSRTYDYTIMFATTERFVHEGEDETFDDVVELKKVLDIDGNLLVSNVPAKEENFIQADAYADGREPDDREHEGYTGNAGAEDKYWYRDTALVLVRNDEVIDFLTRCFREEIQTIAYRPCNAGLESSAESLIEVFTQRVRKQPGNEQHKSQLEALCKYMLQANTAELPSTPRPRRRREGADCWYYRYSQKFNDTVLGKIVHAAYLLDDTTILEQAVQCVKTRLTEDAVLQIKMMRDSRPDKDGVLLRSLDSAVEGYDTLHGRFKLLCNFITGASCDDWAIESIVSVLEQVEEVNEEDGFAMYEVIKSLKGNPLLRQSVIPSICRLAKGHGRFSVALLGSLVSDSPSSLEPEAKSLVFQAIYGTASLCIQKPQDTSRTYGRIETRREQTQMERPVDSLSLLLAAVVVHAMRLDGSDALTTVLRQVKVGAEATPAAQLESTYIPCMQELLPLCAEEHLDSNKRSALSDTIKDILLDYIERSVTKQPSAGGNWKRSEVSCTCKDCDALYTFLRNPTEQSTRLYVGKMRRLHLHQMLDRAGQRCTHETERRGNPQPLVVTKQDVYAMANRGWTSRATQVAKVLRGFRQDPLRAALGEHYERIVNLWNVVLDWSRAPVILQRPPLQDLQQNAAIGAATSGVKRRAEEPATSAPATKKKAPIVIDLCDSD